MKLKNTLSVVLVLLGMEYVNLFGGNVLHRLATQDNGSAIQQIQHAVQKGNLDSVKSILQICGKDEIRLKAILAMDHATPYLYEIMRELFVGRSDLFEVKYFQVGQNKLDALEYFAYKGVFLALLIAFYILLESNPKKVIYLTNLEKIARGRLQLASSQELRDAYSAIIDSLDTLAKTRPTSDGAAAADPAGR